MTTSTTTERELCERCLCEITSTDRRAGYCTNCSSVLSYRRPLVVKGVKGITPTHGMTGTPEYKSYNHMRQRCLNPNNPRYHRYGGRGIKICLRWLKSFASFYSDMGPRPAGTTLERRDNDGDYRPGNCCWATPKEQQNNMRRNVRIAHAGKNLTIAQWARELKIKPVTIRARYRRKWPTKDVFMTDVRRVAKRPRPKLKRKPCLTTGCKNLAPNDYCRLCLQRRDRESKRLPLQVKTCKECGGEFQSRDWRKLYCNKICKRKRDNEHR